MDRQDLIRTVLPLMQAARAYHRHDVKGLGHIPTSSSALIVVNHSLATYDIMLLMTAIYTELHRLPRPLIDRLFFKIPYLSALVTLFGSVQGSPDAAAQLLEAGELVTVAPGGMREALRPSSERYQIRWDRRLGFVKLAMRTKAPIILAACPKADDLYEVYPSQITAWMYKTFRVPVFLARGVGPTPIPRPVKLVHYLSEPMIPPALTGDEAHDEERAKQFHQGLVRRMHELIGEAIQHRG